LDRRNDPRRMMPASARFFPVRQHDICYPGHERACRMMIRHNRLADRESGPDHAVPLVS
jgi:hypothetical protein